MKKLLSIIVPSNNSEKYIYQCLESVNHQNYPDVEILMIDNHSTDNTVNIASRFPKIKIFKQQGRGLASAWNQGIQISRGNYVAFLDSDDWWEPNCLFLHMNELLSNPKKDYTIGDVKYFCDTPRVIPYGFKPSLLEGVHRALMPGCFVGKRTLFHFLGLFDESLKVTMDIQWFHDLKLSDARSSYLDKHVLNKRIHDKNLSYTSAETALYNKELLNVIHRRIKRASISDEFN